MAKKKLIHRDDIPFEDAEAITNFLKEKFPGFKVSFAGDVADPPPEVQKAIKKLNKKFDESLGLGICADCGKKAPGDWPPKKKLPKGWSFFNHPDGTPAFLVCPECEKDEEEE